MKKEQEQSPGLQHVLHVYKHATRKSWQCLNESLSTALKNAIRSGMKFNIDDVSAFPQKGYWFHGENAYAQACGAGRGTDNTSFCLSYESHCNRKPWLWPEATKTPARLYVGAKFTWNNQTVEVTSFNDANGSLTACAYAKKEEYPRRPIKRYTITHSEMMEVRKQADARFKSAMATLNAAVDLDALDAAEREIRKTHETMPFRHFDIEQINDLIESRTKDRKSARNEAAELERWRSGASVYGHFSTVALRIKGEFVETTTGQRASVAEVKRAIPLWQKRHGKAKADAVQQSIDSYPIRRIANDGCQIGCTFVPAAEIERLIEQL